MNSGPLIDATSDCFSWHGSNKASLMIAIPLQRAINNSFYVIFCLCSSFLISILSFKQKYNSNNYKVRPLGD